MKKIVYIAIALLLSAGSLTSCKKANELPPLDRGYAKEFILPDSEDLTRSERAYVLELEEEYENSLN